ncbi:hypothetical protein [Amycolatopsis sp. NPDC059657]|uniref:hypothetical protein n=1 Tax=Amycolatopsis sp. NPDC059657 TaxID=3346899 RepID=UPI0036722F50
MLSSPRSFPARSVLMRAYYVPLSNPSSGVWFAADDDGFKNARTDAETRAKVLRNKHFVPGDVAARHVGNELRWEMRRPDGSQGAIVAGQWTLFHLLANGTI